MKETILIALLFVGVIAIGVGWLILSVFMVVWNVNDIADNGLNFWNAFWLFIVAIGWFGTYNYASANK